MYFTQNNSKEGKRVKNESDKTLLKIFKATFDGKKWRNAIALPFNSDDYSCAHPTLSVDEKYLYFSSDMPGTVGASDIFRVEIFENETYGKPENLGSKINTEGRETFPFISQDDILYFATDGRPGLGGLDIYRSNLNATGEVITVENLGPEINSNFDDFAFFINAENSRGYFSSNRSKGLGLDDIYKFTKVKKCEMIYKGQITESQNLQPLESVSVSMLNDQGVLIAQEFTDSNGNFSFKIECDESYFLSLKKDFYHSSELLWNALEKTDLPKSITMETVIKPIKVGDNLAKILSIENIYFDLDKYDIRADAAYELSKILLILKQESTMKISIRSHTDSRASSEYNHELSSNRANATMMWLIKNGIDAARLTATGYGETQLVNNCSDGVECTDEEHQQNRRSDFIVLQL